MTIKERINLFIESQGISRSAFERAAGLSYGYVAAMRKGFGQEKLDNVLRAFPELNRDWLLYGEGEMLKTPGRHQTASGDHITQTGNNSNSNIGNNIRNSTELFSKALDEISAQRQLTEQTQTLLMEAHASIRELTATNSQLAAQLLALLNPTQPQQ